MDKIAEMLTKIRNAQMAGHKEVRIPASGLKLAIAKILGQEGFISSFSLEQEGKFNVIKIGLKYFEISRTKSIPAIQGIRRVSREGQRMYVGKQDIKNVKNKFGIAIISTSKGVMTGEESKKAGLGGEYVCEVW